MLAAGDPARLAEYVDSRCECYADELSIVADVGTAGLTPPRVEVVGAIARRLETNGAAVEVLLESPDGSAPFEAEGWTHPEIPVRLDLTLGPAGDQWVIAAWTYRPDWSDATIAEIRAAGAPE